MALARFGARPDGGVDRQALSQSEIEARAELTRWGRGLELQPFTDAGANLFLRFEGREPDLPPGGGGAHKKTPPPRGTKEGPEGLRDERE